MRLWTLTLLAVVGCGPAAGERVQSAGAKPSVITLAMGMPGGEAGDELEAAARQMDAGQVAEASAKLEELNRGHPNNAFIVHELGLSYRLLKEPQRAIALWMPLRTALPVDTLAGLASALDEDGRTSDAQALLREEIARHPSSGILYSELGTSLLGAGKKADALALYERSIHVDPAFGASYLHAAEILAGGRSRGMALLYGETFRVLEPNGDRSDAVARLMVQVCKNAVILDATGGGEAKAKVSLAPDIVVNASDAKRFDVPLANQFELAFGPGLAAAHAGGFDLASLHSARRLFLDVVNGNLARSALAAMPIVTWLRALDAAGHLEAYDYWLYGPALPDEAIAWLQAHEKQAHAMAAWVESHPLFPPK
jgi:Tfp pilus assembly protein PilF